MPKRKNEILLSRHILHRSLRIMEGIVVEEKRFLSDVFYLSMLLEKLVLHEKIIVRDVPNIESLEEINFEAEGLNIAYDKDLPSWYFKVDEDLSFGNRIKNNELLNYLSLNKHSFEVIEPEINRFHHDIYKKAKQLEREDGYFNVPLSFELDQIEYSIKNNISFVPDFSSSMTNALNYVDKLNYEFTNQLIKQYNKINKGFKGDIEKLVLNGNNKPLYLPPITTIILSRARNPGEILKIAFELRSEFKAIRDSFMNYENIITDDSNSIKDSLNALNDLESIITSVYPEKDSPLITKVTEWRDISDLIRVLDGTSVTDITFFSKLLLGKPVGILVNKMKVRNVKYLFEFTKDLLNVQNYGNLIQKVFSKEITKEHIVNAQNDGFSENILKIRNSS